MTRYTFGIDVGSRQSGNAIVVINADTMTVDTIVRSNTEYRKLYQIIRVLADKYTPTVIWLESGYINPAVFEMLQDDGLPVRMYHFTDKSKAQLMERLRRAIETGTLTVPDDFQLRIEMHDWKQKAVLVAAALALLGANGGVVVDFK